MKDQFVNKLLKLLPRYIPGFPVILNSQEDISKADQSGDLSYGLLKDDNEYQLPSKARFAASMLFEHIDPSGHQNLFFPYQDKRSFPFTQHRLVARQDTKDRLKSALQQLKSKDNNSSALLRYMTQINCNEKDFLALEKQARIELMELVVHQWNNEIQIDSEYLKCLDIFYLASKLFFRSVLFPNKAKFAEAKKYMEVKVNYDPLLYHHAWVMGMTLWAPIKKLREEMSKDAFKKMVQKGEWSPAAFIVQHKMAPKRAFRVTACKTNLNGLLSYQINPGRLVVFHSWKADNADGLFNYICCGNNFVMDLFTLFVDRAYPGLRKPPANMGCPYVNTIKRPLY